MHAYEGKQIKGDKMKTLTITILYTGKVGTVNLSDYY